ncbi:poly(U)-specific endoribonuclease-like [Pomacea canaliculata]|uniref:poly(U)-specific endoribonuclease-like n=1 Tax=Pomacea canaliculata TaxID=400727 RepID=UPI000D729403|nr:poly(U)-specific endoribonuclease-like [Pomacea canaliculata]
MFVPALALFLTFALASGDPNSCQGRCFAQLDTSQPCQCNTYCERYEDCCSDFFTLCRGIENCHHISAADLAKVAQDIYAADENQVDGSHYKLNFQKRYSTGVDNPLAFFTSLDETVFQSATFKGLSDLEDNYEKVVHVQENYTAAEWAEVQSFISNVVSSGPMGVALEFLAARGCISNNTEAWKTLIEEIWFNLYSRTEGTSSAHDSSGFEHVFLGELRGHSVLGLNNWIEYYKEEKSGRINYLGWIDYMTNPNIVSISFVWEGAQAPVRSFFVGTSPEFDMAVATLCAVARGNQGCHLTINGKSFTYQTYVIRHNHNQQLQITAAYPIVPAHSAPVNATGEELVG